MGRLRPRRRALDLRRQRTLGPAAGQPADVLGWHTDERYPADARSAGLPIVPTTFVDARGETRLYFYAGRFSRAIGSARAARRRGARRATGP
jgi:hypothetical protein